MGQLDGKVSLVAGGTGGIGAAIARRFVEQGAKVYLGGRNPEKTAAVASACGAAPVQLDVTSADDWKAALAEVEAKSGRLDILVNAQGETVPATLEEATLEQFRYMMGINAESVFLGVQAALPLMRKSGKGSIVNVGSIIQARPTSNLAGYGASKGAMTALSKSIALHCAEIGSGIRVNVVHPGGILTEMLERAVGNMGMPYEDARAVWEATHPLGRFGVPAEIADAVLYFASDLSGFTTGAELYVDGGAAIRP
jgi:NAD(P)-dependent dehydrogenase (short-subunit alcohol dehydrogenase family)